MLLAENSLPEKGSSEHHHLIFDEGKKYLSDGELGILSQTELEILASNGDVDRAIFLGTNYQYGYNGVAKEINTAIKWYKIAKDNGSAEAEYRLGLIYVGGDGVPSNYSQGFKFLIASAKKGYNHAQGEVSSLYLSGKGVRQNLILAHVWSNIGTANKDEFSSIIRRRVEEKLSPAEINQAQEIASRCLASNYKECTEPSFWRLWWPF